MEGFKAWVVDRLDARGGGDERSAPRGVSDADRRHDQGDRQCLRGAACEPAAAPTAARVIATARPTPHAQLRDNHQLGARRGRLGQRGARRRRLAARPSRRSGAAPLHAAGWAQDVGGGGRKYGEGDGEAERADEDEAEPAAQVEQHLAEADEQHADLAVEGDEFKEAEEERDGREAQQRAQRVGVEQGAKVLARFGPEAYGSRSAMSTAQLSWLAMSSKSASRRPASSSTRLPSMGGTSNSGCAVRAK